MKIHPIPIQEFLNTGDEWHSFVIGWCEVMCPKKPRRPIPQKYLRMIDDEYWYYVFGMVCGVFTWMVIILLAAIIVLGVIL